MIGRALTDIQRMNGETGTPQTEGEMTTIEGYAPVTGMRDYQMEVNSYTRGQGHLTCTFRGYEPCRNAEAVIEEIAYRIRSAISRIRRDPSSAPMVQDLTFHGIKCQSTCIWRISLKKNGH